MRFIRVLLGLGSKSAIAACGVLDHSAMVELLAVDKCWLTENGRRALPSARSFGRQLQLRGSASLLFDWRQFSEKIFNGIIIGADGQRTIQA